MLIVLEIIYVLLTSPCGTFLGGPFIITTIIMIIIVITITMIMITIIIIKKIRI